jgi:hypothetical protein
MFLTSVAAMLCLPALALGPVPGSYFLEGKALGAIALDTSVARFAGGYNRQACRTPIK